MANLKSSKKDAKRSIVRARGNAAYETSLKTATKKFFAALKDGNRAEAEVLLKEAQSRIGLAQKKGILKKNTAARRVSRLARSLATGVVAA